MTYEAVREIDHEPLPSQQEFYDLETRFQGFSGPVGSGKSAALCVKALKLAYSNPGLPGVIGAPTYTMLRDVTRPAFLDILATNGIPHTFKKADNDVILHEPRSVVRFRSLDNPLRLVGSNLAWFGIDELTYSKQDAWRRLQARLRHPKAKLLCGFGVWTPKGFDWVYSDFVSPERKKDYSAIFAKPKENKYLGTGFYESLEGSYAQRFYEQEVLGRYLNIFAGRVYYAFDRELQVKPCRYDPDLPIVWSLDFNNSPMCSVIAQVEVKTTPARFDPLHGQFEDEKVTRIFRVLDEISLVDSNIGEACQEFERKILSLTDRLPVRVILHGDSSGNNASHAGKSDWELVLRYFRDTPDIVIEKRVPPANGPVKDRINAVNAKLLNFRREIGAFIDPKCKELIKDLEQVGFKVDMQQQITNILDQSGGRTHISDAFGYLIIQEEPLRNRGGYNAQRLF